MDTIVVIVGAVGKAEQSESDGKEEWWGEVGMK